MGAPTWLAQAIGWRYGLVLWTLVLLTGVAVLGLTAGGHRRRLHAERDGHPVDGRRPHPPARP